MNGYGIHRSLHPRGVLPQQADVLDTAGPLAPDEVSIDVEYLNIDSASWHQIRSECGGSADEMAGRILEIVRAAGKMHNPTTGSGGMLVGTVRAVGSERCDPRVGSRIATLVSLTLTPLVLEEIVSLDPGSEKVQVRGRAILFGSGIYAEVPTDLPEDAVLRILDVCGAPAWVSRLARPGMRVAVIGGGGKSGMLACAAARERVGADGAVLALCWPPGSEDAARDAGAETAAIDATDPLAVRAAVEGTLGAGRADLVLVCTNVPGCEGGAILACSDEGRVLFFSMATSFTVAALTAEGLGRSCEMTIGNGYVPGHAQMALDLARRHPRLLERFSA